MLCHVEQLGDVRQSWMGDTMLEQMRDNARNWLIYVLFGAIIVVFSINFGPGFDQFAQSGCQARGGQAAVVNGEEISRQVFQMQWRNFVQSRKIPANIIKSLNLKGRIMDQMIDTVLLSQMARNYGILISDDEVHNRILDDPSFKSKGGIFDPIIFRRMVNNYLGLSTEEYENFLRQNLQAQRMREILTGGMVVSDREVKQSYILSNTKVRLQYVAFDPSALKLPVKVEAKDVDAFVKKKLVDIKDYYNKNLNKYKQPEQIRAKHILLKLSSKASAKEIAEKTKKLRGFRKQALKKPIMFTILAFKHSEGPSKTRGGDLNFFKRGAMHPKFEKAAFALKKPNDISDVVQTPFGLHIIQLTARKKAINRTVKQKDVQKEIATILLKKQKAIALVKGVAQELQTALTKGADFKTLMKPFQKPKKVAKKPAARKAAPATRKAAPATRKAAPTARKAPAARKAPVARKAPASRKAAPAAKALTKADIKKMLRGKIKLKTTPAFTQESDVVSGIGASGVLVRKSFTLTKKNPAPAKPFEVKGKLYVVKLKKRIEPNMKKKFEKEQEDLKQRLLNRKKEEFVRGYLENLRKKLKKEKKITLNKALLSYKTQTPRR